MFWNKKKTQLEKMIDENGIDFVAVQLAILINEKISSLRVARQFVLEELDAARQGNDVAKRFVKNSGFDESDYKGAMNRSFEEVDGPNGPQQLILQILTSQLSHDIELMVKVRTTTVEHIMKEWNLGKYQNESN